MVKLIGVDDSGRLPDGARDVLVDAGLATAEAVREVGAQASRAVPAPRTRVSVLGDSLSTYNYAENKGTVWWQTALARSGGILVQNHAVAGSTAADLLVGWNTETQSADPEAAQVAAAERDDSQTWLVMIGGNDAANERTPEAFRADLETLADRAAGASRTLVLVTPPKPFPSMLQQIDQYVVLLEQTRDLAAARGLALIDLWHDVGDHLNGLPEEWDQGDGLHITPEGHESLGRLAAERLRKAIGGPGEFASAVWSSVPFPGATIDGDGASTANVVTVPETSRDLFPSGAALLMDIAHGTNTYVSAAKLLPIDQVKGKTVRLTFSYEVVSMSPDHIDRGKRDSGLFVHAGGTPTWDFYTIWGGVKTEGARGVASVEMTFPDSTSNTKAGFSIVLASVARPTADDPKVQVRLGAVRVEVLGGG